MLEQYQKFNRSFSNQLIFRFNSGSGFYSEFNNMILAMLYCLENKIRFSICSQDGLLTLKHGWQDYFLPFCDEVNDEFNFRYNQRLRTKDLKKLRAKLKIGYYKRRHNIDYLTQDIFIKSRNYYKNKIDPLAIPELGLSGHVQEVAKALTAMVYRFTPEVEAKIQAIKTTLELPEKYAAMQVRGGDKITEFRCFPPLDYMKVLQTETKLKEVFILTDDYTLFQELQSGFPDYRFYTLCRPEERGYFMNQLVELSKEQRYNEHIKLLASMEIIRDSVQAVVPFNANPGMFLGICPHKTILSGVDSKDWQLI